MAANPPLHHSTRTPPLWCCQDHICSGPQLRPQGCGGRHQGVAPAWIQTTLGHHCSPGGMADGITIVAGGAEQTKWRTCDFVTRARKSSVVALFELFVLKLCCSSGVLLLALVMWSVSLPLPSSIGMRRENLKSAEPSPTDCSDARHQPCIQSPGVLLAAEAGSATCALSSRAAAWTSGRCEYLASGETESCHSNRSARSSLAGSSPALPLHFHCDVPFPLPTPVLVYQQLGSQPPRKALE